MQKVHDGSWGHPLPSVDAGVYPDGRLVVSVNSNLHIEETRAVFKKQNVSKRPPEIQVFLG